MPFAELPDGGRLYVEVHGPPGAPPLMLLEGLGGDVPGWRRNVPRLAERYRVIAYDHRGNGRSSLPPEQATMATFADDAEALLDHLGAAGAHLYGQSFGGMVALEAALTRPARVRSLVLAAAHAGPVGASRPEARATAPKGRPWEALYAEAFVREHPEHVREDLELGKRQVRSLLGERRQWQAMQGWEAWDRLGRVRTPTLVLHGTEDRVVGVENARRLAAAIPGAELHLLEGAGHVYHSEQAAASDEAVLSFLNRVEGGRR